MGKISESHRPGGQHTTVTSFRYLYNTSLSPAGIFTSHRCHLLQVDLQHITVTSCRYLYNTSLSPPSGRFTAHHCHLLQVSFRHITVTSCRYHPVLVEGLLSMGLPRLVSFSCLPLHIPGSAPRPGPWLLDTGHWTLDTGH